MRGLQCIRIALLVFITFVFCMILFINQRLYNQVIQLNVYVCCFLVLVLLLLRVYPSLEASSKRKRLVLIYSAAVSIVLCLLFIVFKPQYTLNASMDRVLETSAITDIKLHETEPHVQTSPKPGFFVFQLYQFTGMQEGKEVELLFDPVSGEYWIE